MARQRRRTSNPAFPVAIVVDSREQRPYRFDSVSADASDGGGFWAFELVRAGLPSGDYSLAGFESRIAIERKSVNDLFGTIAQGRDRFERELDRLNQFEAAFVVVEGEWSEVTRPPTPDLTFEQWAGALGFHLDEISDQARAALSTWYDREYGLNPEFPRVRSQLPPRIVFRSVIAWQQRFPRVHWWFCPGREWAQVATVRIFERWLKEEEKRQQSQQQQPQT